MIEQNDYLPFGSIVHLTTSDALQMIIGHDLVFEDGFHADYIVVPYPYGLFEEKSFGIKKEILREVIQEGYTDSEAVLSEANNESNNELIVTKEVGQTQWNYDPNLAHQVQKDTEHAMKIDKTLLEIANILRRP